jgi:hypothetical protein
VITKSALLCPTLPKFKHLCLVTCKTFDDVLLLLKKAKLELSDILQAIEFMDADALNIVTRQLKYTSPLDQSFPFYVLVEVATNKEGPESSERLFKLLGENSDIILDGVVA